MTEYIIHVVHECAFHIKCAHRLSGKYWSREHSSYEKLREKIHDVFQLPPSAPFELKYSGRYSDEVSIVNDEELYDAQVRQNMKTLELKVVYNCSSPLVRVVHGDTYYMLTPPPGQPEFCYEELHGRVRKKFHLSDSDDFVFRFQDPDIYGLQMIVASDDDMKYALAKESPTHLEVDIKAVEDNDSISHSSGKRSSPEISPGIALVEVCYDDNIGSLVLSAGDLQSSCAKFQSRVRDLFKLSRSIELELSYVDKDGNIVTMSKREKLKDVLSRQPGEPLRLNMTTYPSVVRKALYVVKVKHNGIVRRMNLLPDGSEFSYEKFRSTTRDLFKLPPAIQFVLSYVDEDQESIIMVEDDDLRDALVVQSLDPLMVELMISDPWAIRFRKSTN